MDSGGQTGATEEGMIEEPGETLMDRLMDGQTDGRTIGGADGGTDCRHAGGGERSLEDDKVFQGRVLARLCSETEPDRKLSEVHLKKLSKV